MINKDLKRIVLLSIALGMGIAALVLNIMQILEVNMGMTFLSIGLICLAINGLENKKN